MDLAARLALRTGVTNMSMPSAPNHLNLLKDEVKKWDSLLQPGVNLLATDHQGTMATVLVRAMGRDVLLHEESSYGPTRDPFKGWEEGDEYPFETNGTRWRVDLTDGFASSEDFTAHENTIQGLVYALGAIELPGELPPESYVSYIIELANRPRDEVKPVDIDQTLVNRLWLSHIVAPVPLEA